MKLRKDFGVRALLAVLGVTGLLGAIFFILATQRSLSMSDILAILAIAQAPALSATSFYFATRDTNTTPAEPKPTETPKDGDKPKDVS
jgi:hypothetical protein